MIEHANTGNDLSGFTKQAALRIVQRHKGVWDQPPENIYTGRFSDAPLLGNGDVGVILAGTLDTWECIFGKNEFLSQNEGIPKAMSRLQLRIPDMKGAAYHMEQRLLHAEVTGRHSKENAVVQTQSWMQATDTRNNLFFTRITCTGSAELPASVHFLPGVENTHLPVVAVEGKLLAQDVRADLPDKLEGYDTARARIAVALLGAADSEVRDNALHFTLRPGQVYTLAVSIMSVFDDQAYRERALENLRGLTAASVETLYAAHCAWWEAFWGRSYVELPDRDVERAYYGSLYLLACCMRENETAPGLYGPWVMKNMYWGGEPPLNYNYEAPYLCTIPTNHVELSENYEKLLFDWVPNARKNAEAHGHRGLYFEAYPGPLPYGSMFSANRWTGLDDQGRDCYMMQKSNAVFAAVPMILRYFYTREESYARRVYPFLKEVGAFWVEDLQWDGARYVICGDYVHEGPVSLHPQTNPLTSLGFVRLLFQGLLAISAELGEDEEQREIWRDRLEHLSDYPVFLRNGQEVFRNQEEGSSREWSRSNGYDEDFSEWSTPCAVPEMALIYPGNQIGCFSDPELLRIARNTVAQQGKWRDANMTCFFYPSAARVGHDPDEILRQLSGLVREDTYPNMTLCAFGGGIENLNTVPATLVEMFCQSYQGKLWVFPNWPAGMDARFGNLLAYGNFLVSSRYKDGTVQYIRMESRKGRPVQLVNPWPDRPVGIYRNGLLSETLTGAELSIATEKNEVLSIAPEGVSYQELLEKMLAPDEPEHAAD